MATDASLVVILAVIILGAPSPLKRSLVKDQFGLRLIYSSSVMALAVWLVTQGFSRFLFSDAQRLDSFWIALIGIGVGMIVFVYSLLKWDVLTVREWLSLPFGKKILRK